MFVRETRVYKIDDQEEVRDFVGYEVTISGRLDGDTVKIDKIARK